MNNLQPGRLLREKWRNPWRLPQELYAMLSSLEAGDSAQAPAETSRPPEARQTRPEPVSPRASTPAETLIRQRRAAAITLGSEPVPVRVEVEPPPARNRPAQAEAAT